VENVRSDRPETGHDQVLAELDRAGFGILGSTGPGVGEDDSSDARWELSPNGTGRGVYFSISDEGAGRVYTIDVYEFRGGEGCEKEELRSTDLSEVLAAIPHWADWAKEPFVRPRGWWQRLCFYLGLSYGSADASGSPRTRRG
jgi:hypothetical protein